MENKLLRIQWELYFVKNSQMPSSTQPWWQQGTDSSYSLCSEQTTFLCFSPREFYFACS